MNAAYKEETITRVAEWCPDVAALRDERNTLRLEAESGRIASLLLTDLMARAENRGYPDIASAIEAAPLKAF
jgi:hypothetical protein